MKIFVNTIRLGLIITGVLTFSATAAQDTEALAKAAQNPLASLISLPFQLNTNFDVGPQDKTQYVLNIQPVYPVLLNDDWNLITRTIHPSFHSRLLDKAKAVKPVLGIFSLQPGSHRRNRHRVAGSRASGRYCSSIRRVTIDSDRACGDWDRPSSH